MPPTLTAENQDTRSNETLPTPSTAKSKNMILGQPSPMQSTLTAKGQMTLPKEARDFLGLKPGDKVRFFLGPNGRVSILPVLPMTALRGLFAGRVQQPVTLEEMDEAIAAGAVERYQRSRQP